MTTADSTTTQGALNAETTLRLQGDSRLSNFVGKVLASGIPDANTPLPSAYGTLVDLVDGENMLQGMWRLDSQKQRKITIKDNGVSVKVNPDILDFLDGDDDGFLITAVSNGITIQLDALANWWTGDPGDGSAEQDIVASTAVPGMVEFDHDRFATGISVTKTTIGYIAATWSVVSAVTLRGRKSKVGPNP